MTTDLIRAARESVTREYAKGWNDAIRAAADVAANAAVAVLLRRNRDAGPLAIRLAEQSVRIPILSLLRPEGGEAQDRAAKIDVVGLQMVRDVLFAWLNVARDGRAIDPSISELGDMIRALDAALNREAGNG